MVLCESEPVGRDGEPGVGASATATAVMELRPTDGRCQDGPQIEDLEH